MARRHARVLVLLLIAAVLSGCGGGATDDAARTGAKVIDDVIVDGGRVADDVPASRGGQVIREAPVGPVVDQVSVTALEAIQVVNTRVSNGTLLLIDRFGNLVSAQRQQELQEWAKRTVCFYLDHQAELADGLTTEEVVKLTIDELEPASARRLAQTVVDSTMYVQNAYIDSGFSGAFLASVKVGLCDLG